MPPRLPATAPRPPSLQRRPDPPQSARLPRPWHLSPLPRRLPRPWRPPPSITWKASPDTMTTRAMSSNTDTAPACPRGTALRMRPTSIGTESPRRCVPRQARRRQTIARNRAVAPRNGQAVSAQATPASARSATGFAHVPTGLAPHTAVDLRRRQRLLAVFGAFRLTFEGAGSAHPMSPAIPAVRAVCVASRSSGTAHCGASRTGSGESLTLAAAPSVGSIERGCR